jgi:RES domain-containing protein
MFPHIITDYDTKLFKSVEGTFYRAIDPTYRSEVITGSRLAGRYSSSTQRTLYLSATREGMAASIGIHKKKRSTEQEVIELEVAGGRIFDLRDEDSCRSIGIELSDAISPWQELVAQELRPRSWDVRDRIIELGGKGLIDPSRQRPGLWHLVLFEWNKDTAPSVTVKT